MYVLNNYNPGKQQFVAKLGYWFSGYLVTPLT